MTALVRAELLKLRTTRATWGLVAVAIGITLVLLGLQLRNAGLAETASLGTTASTRAILVASGSAALVILVLGVLIATGELRHRTLGATFLVTPARGRVLSAKLLTAGLAGLALSALGLGITLVIAVPWLAAHGVTGEVVNRELLLVTLATLAAGPLYGMLGLALGALVRNQTVAVVLGVLWFLIGEGLIGAMGLRGLMPWLPGGASRALVRDVTLPGLLPAWAGGLLLLAYVAALAVPAWWLLNRTDID
jgi:ABC-type transport system involved in multi-copper enzyme maturation permease subunit